MDAAYLGLPGMPVIAHKSIPLLTSHIDRSRVSPLPLLLSSSLNHSGVRLTGHEKLRKHRQTPVVIAGTGVCWGVYWWKCDGDGCYGFCLKYDRLAPPRGAKCRVPSAAEGGYRWVILTALVGSAGLNRTASSIVGVGGCLDPCPSVDLQRLLDLAGPPLGGLDADEAPLEVGHHVSGQ